MKQEPVRVAVYVAALLAAIGTMLIDLSSGVALLAAGGKALLALSVVAGGAEVARSQAWAPGNVDELLDADAVIRAAERDADTDTP